MSHYQCPRCLQRGKTWEGDDPVCGFYESGKFNPLNWNCATLNAIRIDKELVTIKDGQSTVGILSREDVGIGAIGWYKNRGRVDFFRHFYYNQDGDLDFALRLIGDKEPKDPLF